MVLRPPGGSGGEQQQQLALLLSALAQQVVPERVVPELALLLSTLSQQEELRRSRGGEAGRMPGPGSGSGSGSIPVDPRWAGGAPSGSEAHQQVVPEQVVPDVQQQVMAQLGRQIVRSLKQLQQQQGVEGLLPDVDGQGLLVEVQQEGERQRLLEEVQSLKQQLKQQQEEQQQVEAQQALQQAQVQVLQRERVQQVEALEKLQGQVQRERAQQEDALGQVRAANTLLASELHEAELREASLAADLQAVRQAGGDTEGWAARLEAAEAGRRMLAQRLDQVGGREGGQ